MICPNVLEYCGIKYCLTKDVQCLQRRDLGMKTSTIILPYNKIEELIRCDGELEEASQKK